jgi:ketosteroid isomerase-like protein
MPSKLNLPGIIREYVAASNRHEVKSILSCFADGAIVLDEAEEFEGKEAIQGWIVQTIEKYQFRFKPLACRGEDGEIIVTMEVAGTFDGSPVTLDYHFIIEDGKILSLAID